MLFKRKWGFYFLELVICLSLISSVSAGPVYDDNNNTQGEYFHKGYIGETFVMYLWYHEDINCYDYIKINPWEPNTNTWDPKIVKLIHYNKYIPIIDPFNNLNCNDWVIFKIVGVGQTKIKVNVPKSSNGDVDTYEYIIIGQNGGEPL